MEHNDYFFYLVVALSIIGSIVKAVKKKPDEGEPLPKKAPTGDILRKILEELQDKDDYIPRNPVPAPVPAAKPASKQVLGMPSTNQVFTDLNRKGKVEKGYEVPEAGKKPEHATQMAKNQVVVAIEEQPDPLMASIDLSDRDEMKKAIIYSEIFRTKF